MTTPQLTIDSNFDPLAPIPIQPLPVQPTEIIPPRSASLSPAIPEKPKPEKEKKSIAKWLNNIFKPNTLGLPQTSQRRLSVSIENDSNWQQTSPKNSPTTSPVIAPVQTENLPLPITQQRRRSISQIGSSAKSPQEHPIAPQVENLQRSFEVSSVATNVQNAIDQSTNNEYGRYIHPSMFLNDARQKQSQGTQKIFSTRRTISQAHNGAGINDSIFSSDGSIIASGAADNLVKIWDASEGQLLLKPLQGPQKQVLSLSLSSFHQEYYLVLAASRDSGAYIWDLKKGTLKDILTGHSGSVHHAMFLQDPTKAATAGSDKTIRFWDLGKLSNYHTIKTNSKCHDFVVLQDVSTVVSAHNDSLRFSDLRTGDVTGEMLGHVDSSGLAEDVPITSVEADKSGTLLVTTCKDNLVRVIDSRMHKVLYTLGCDEYKVGMNWANADFSPSGKYVAAGGEDGALYIWDLLQGVFHARIPKHSGPISKVHWIDGMLVSSSWDNSICVWYE